MENNKSPDNDGLTKGFCCTLWNEIKNIFMNPLRESKCLKVLSSFYLVLVKLVNGRFLGENRRLIVDIIETCDIEQLEGYLVAVDFKKAFDSFNHNFLITALEHYGFGNYFIKCIKILLKNQESFVINGVILQSILEELDKEIQSPRQKH